MNRKNLLLVLLGTLLLAEGLYIADRWTTLGPSSGPVTVGHSAPKAISANRLKIGPDASAGPIYIELTAPVELDFKKRSEVLALRKTKVAAHPELVQEPYVPYSESFGEIADGKPWWGVDGLFFYSQGKKAIEGPSERSTMIVNPFLLLDAQETEVPFITVHRLDFVDFFEAKFSDPKFSCFPKLTNLTWFPKEKKADVTYLLGDFLDFINTHAKQKIGPDNLTFDFRALNARDWGFNFVYFDLANSSRMVQPTHPAEAAGLADYLHVGGSCGYAGGCNNHSPDQLAIDKITVTDLPAAARFLLWRKKPASTQSEPDFVFTVKFQ